MSNPEVEIITYGGGDLLREVFNAISMLFYGDYNQSSIVQPLCIVSAMIGGAWGISKCFFQSYTDAFLTQYFFPLLAIPTLLIVPQARVHIIDKMNENDKVNGKPIVVDHVPFLFAKVDGMSSYWGHQITKAIETVMHTPNDAMYSKTGMIFGAESSLDFSRLKINNGTLVQNLHLFTQQCIIYDVALGRYTIDEFRKSIDLLSFLKEKTSRVRLIPYTDPFTKQVDFLSCQESLDRMRPLFDQEVSYYTKHEILKKTPMAYQTLLSFKAASEDRISGQMTNAVFGDESRICRDILAVNAFNDASARFAVERAKDNQRSTYQTAGALAGPALVKMRIAFEAFIYASFALILPLSLLPGGIRFIGKWIFLNIWIQLWPPLYGIINYNTMIYSQKYINSVMGEISNGFSLFTSAGFQDLAYDTAAIGGFLALSVPLLSFYLLQNLQSIVHLSGSLMTPAHSSAISAGGEMSSGNYSYSNSSMGQMSYENQTAFQQNTAPSLSSGYFTDNYGTHQVKHGQNAITANQDPSNLNTSISTAEAYSSSLQHAMQNAESRVNTLQASHTETQGIAERSTADLIQHVASSDSYSNGYSTTEAQSAQESANFVMNATESWAKQEGLSTKEGLEYMASMYIASGHCSALSDEGRTKAENIFNSQDFQEHYQRALSTANNESANFMTDEGKRYAENFTNSMEKMRSSQEQVSDAHSELNQISENLSYVQSHTNTVNTNLNTEFSNWLNEKGNLGAIFDRGRETELNGLRDQFIEEKCQKEFGSLSRYQDPSFSSKTDTSLKNNWGDLKNSTQQKAIASGLSFDQTNDNSQSVFSQFDAQSAKISHKHSTQQQSIGNTHHNLKNQYSEESQKTGLYRLNMRAKDNVMHTVNAVVDLSGAQSHSSVFDLYADPYP